MREDRPFGDEHRSGPATLYAGGPALRQGASGAAVARQRDQPAVSVQTAEVTRHMSLGGGGRRRFPHVGLESLSIAP